MPAQVTSFSSMVDETSSVDGTSINATYLNGITSAINHLERLIWSDSETVPTESDFLFNATYNGTNWNRTDTNKAASKIELDQYGGVVAKRVASGANPITWANGRFPFQGYVQNLTITTASSTTITVAWDAVVLKETTSGFYRMFPSGSVTITITAAGANGLDTGTIAANTLYYISIIAKNDETLAAVVHLASGTLHGPSMPSGYTWAYTVSFCMTDSGSAIISDRGFYQKGNVWRQYNRVTANVMRLVNASSPANSNWIAVNCSSFIPAGFGKSEVILSGFMNTADADYRYLSVGPGGVTLSNGINGICIAMAGLTAPRLGFFLEAPILTDGTANQQIQYKLNGTDGTVAVTIDVQGFIVPTIRG